MELYYWARFTLIPYMVNTQLNKQILIEHTGMIVIILEECLYKGKFDKSLYLESFDWFVNALSINII